MNQYVTGAVIKELREKNRMTQLQLAEKLGVSDKSVSKWETARGFPDITLLEPIAETFGISVTELISGNTVHNSNMSANMLMSKTMIRFFTISDYEEEEIWLRKQHQSGWKLVKMVPPCIYIFEACEPQDVIYRLDYKNSGQTEEYMQMLRDFGWEYFARCNGWLYFRKPKEAAVSEQDGELFSDDASRVELISKVVKTRLVPLAVVFLCCVLPGFVRAVTGGYSGGSGSFFSIFFGIMFVLYVFLIVYCGTKLRKIRAKYDHYSA